MHKTFGTNLPTTGDLYQIDNFNDLFLFAKKKNLLRLLFKDGNQYKKIANDDINGFLEILHRLMKFKYKLLHKKKF